MIIEPSFVDIASKDNIFSRIIGKIMAAMDADGYNNIERWLSKEEYEKLFQAFLERHNIKKMNIKHFRSHMFVEMLV